MLARCISAINAAAGRSLTEAELARIERTVNAAGRRLALADRERWSGLSVYERTAEVSAQAVKDLQTEARLNKYRTILATLEAARDQASVADRAPVDETIASLREMLAGAAARPQDAAPQRVAVSGTTPYESSTYARAAQLAAESPDRVVMLEGGEKMSAREAMAQIEHEFAESSGDAELAQVAAECYLRTGGMPAAATGFRGAGVAGQSAIGRGAEKALEVAGFVLGLS